MFTKQYLACKVPAESDWEPVEDFNDRDKTDSKAKATKTSKAGDEVKPGHLWGFLKLCKQCYVLHWYYLSD